MSSYTIKHTIGYENSALVEPAVRKHLKVPGGVTAYAPIRLSFGDMSRKEPSKVPAPAGLTQSAFDVEAPGVTRVSAASDTARGSSEGTASRAQPEWVFGGGDITLKIQIGIYIIDKFAKVPKLFQIIMNHEYLHVRDTLKLAEEISKKIEADPSVKRWLNGERWTGAAFFDRIGAIWGTEAKRLGDALDSGPAYDRHKAQIAKLMPR